MKIISLKYTDDWNEWKLEKTYFKPLTLLVGVSGVGKTKILKSIMSLLRVTKGDFLNGIDWEIEFEINKDIYVWSGSYEKRKSLPKLIDEKTFIPEEFIPVILNERIVKNNKDVLIERDNEKIFLSNHETNKLPKTKSVLYSLSEEDEIKPIKAAFNRIIFNDATRSKLSSFIKIPSRDFSIYKDIDTIKNSRLSIVAKLAFCYKNEPNIFNEIKEAFIDIFTQVTDLKVEPLIGDDVPVELLDAQFVQIKEKNINDWIFQFDISSGMYRTLTHIADIYLQNENSVILIDEFENSLGVNCIGILQDIECDSKNIQYIITSHHPYIIDNLSYNNWKIVTRNGSTVKTIDASEFDLEQSKHKNFLKLINLKEFKNGINL